MTKVKEKVDKENKFIPLYYDVLFYKVFGDDNDTEPLKWLIKQILNIEPVEVQILNGKVLGDKYKTKRSYLDLLVKLQDNTKVSIEVNTNTGKYVTDRNLFFLAKVMGNDLKVNDSYTNFSKHYQINFNVNQYQTKPVMEYKLVNEETKEILSDKMQIINIDISYFSKKCYTSSELENFNEFEKMMSLLGSKDEQHTDIFSHEEGIVKKIMDKADKFRADVEVVEMFDRDELLESLRKREKEEAIKEAVLENTKEVTKEVKSNTTREIAINFIKENVDVSVISKATGLTIDEINKLKENTK